MQNLHYNYFFRSNQTNTIVLTNEEEVKHQRKTTINNLHHLDTETQIRSSIVVFSQKKKKYTPIIPLRIR